MLRVWVQPEMLSDNVVVLTEDAFVVATLPRQDVHDAEKHLLRGAPPDQVLGPAARALPLADIEAVQVDNRGATISLGVREGRRQIEHTVQFLMPRHREVFAALREKLGPGWREETVASKPMEAATAAAPVTLAALVGFLTVLGGLATWPLLNGRADPNAPLGGFFNFPTPGIIWLGGGALFLGLLLWAVVEIKRRPPAKITIVREKATP